MGIITVYVRISAVIPGCEDYAGEMKMELEKGATAGSLKSILGIPDMGLIAVVNHRMTSDDTQLSDGDRVYILPGLSGG